MNYLLSHLSLFLPLSPPQSQKLHQPHHYRQLVPSSSSHANQTEFAFLCCTDATWRPTVPMAVTKATAIRAQSYKINVITTPSSTASSRRNAFRSGGCAIRSTIAVWSASSTFSIRPTRTAVTIARKSVRRTSCRALTASAYTSRSSATVASTVPTMSSIARTSRRARTWNVITTAGSRRTARTASVRWARTWWTPPSACRRRSALRSRARMASCATSSARSSRERTNARVRQTTSASAIDALE